MDNKDIITTGILLLTAFAVWYAPIQAVKTGVKLEKEKQKESAKMNLFLNLFSFREATPVNFLHPDFVKALNQIDVVYMDHHNVLHIWHELHRTYANESLLNRQKLIDDLRQNLLIQMGDVLGYKVSEIDFSKSYSPRGHGDEWQANIELRVAQYNYYKDGNEMILLQSEWLKRALKEQEV